jgi:hypothetical protein
MALSHVITEVKTLSIAAKIGLAAGVLVVLLLLIGGAVGIVGHFKDAAYQKREAQRETERAQLETEKSQLQAEKTKALTDAAESKASADAYKTVAESKRADRSATAKELAQVEADHTKHKQEAEATGNTLGDDELRAELCRRLAARGYPPCPN